VIEILNNFSQFYSYQEFDKMQRKFLKELTTLIQLSKAKMQQSLLRQSKNSNNTAITSP